MSEPTEGTTLLEEWQNYREHVVPSSASHRQLWDIQHAFYAGAYIFYVLAALRVKATPDEPDALDPLLKEMHAFFQATLKEAGISPMMWGGPRYPTQ